MIKAIIVEDELLNRDNLQQLLLKYCKDIMVIAIAASADEGIALIRKHQPQLVFLDIQMPGKDGFQMLQQLNRDSFEIIFVTAYSEYGIRAIKFSAIDYLLKPVDISDLKAAVNKAIKRIKEKQENKNLQNLLHYLQHNNKPDRRIAIASLKEIRLVSVKDILRCESENTYTFFYLTNGEKILSTTPIITYEELLHDYGFLRCHQTHLVNKSYVKSFLKTDGNSLLMQDNCIIPVSRQKKDMIKKKSIAVKIYSCIP